MRKRIVVSVNALTLFASLAFVPYLCWLIYQHGPWINWLESSLVFGMALMGAYGYGVAAWEDLNDELEK